jgi:hypothetical protein
VILGAEDPPIPELDNGRFTDGILNCQMGHMKARLTVQGDKAELILQSSNEEMVDFFDALAKL